LEDGGKVDLKKHVTPALVLLFLSPMIGEMLSSSSPPAEFFGPFALWAFPMMYGCGALLVREAVFRWKKGWVSLLLLGAAYGIAEEALACKSFFDPNWADIGVLGSYGRWAGVNWLWSFELTVYHAAISIATPILLTTFLFPEKRDQPWLTAKGLKYAAGFFIFIEVFCFALITFYRPQVHLILLAMGAIALLVYAAYKVPHPFPWERLFAPLTVLETKVRSFMKKGAKTITEPSKRKLFFSGVAFMFGFYLVPAMTMAAGASAPVTGLALLLFFTLLGTRIALVSNFGRNWTERHQTLLLAGGLTFFIMFCPVWEFSGGRTDNPMGLTAVGISFTIFLVWIYRRLGRNETVARQAAVPACAAPN